MTPPSIPAHLQSLLADRYVIEREIGAGGMATVYLAHDRRHDRYVAVKVVRPEVSAVMGAERFINEIRTTAQLQHPNLLPLFDSGNAGGVLFYVMPYIDGESLRDRLERERELPVADACRIAITVARALECAHRAGVIHRDLKPENILLREGQPLVADFGVALAIRNATGDRLTASGLTLGTPQYMSPEQATADRQLDGRSDVFALGAVLYEMLVGNPPHMATTAQGVIAKVLSEVPVSVRTLRPSVPPGVEQAVSRALEKLPADRFASAGEFAAALEAAAVDASGAAMPVTPAAAPLIAPPARQRTRTVPIAAGIVIAAIGAIALWTMVTAPDAPPPNELEYTLEIPPEHGALGAAPGPSAIRSVPGVPVIISPDGRHIVYMAQLPGQPRRLYVRTAGQRDARLVPGTDHAAYPTFAPDGQWVAFVVDRQLKKVNIVTNASLTLRDSVPAGPMAWGAGDVIAMGAASTDASSGIRALHLAGDSVRLVVAPDPARGEGSLSYPVIAADGRTVLFTARGDGLADARLGAADLRSGERLPLDHPGAYPLGVVGGQLIYVDVNGAVMRVPYDARRGRVQGEPEVADTGVMLRIGGLANASMSDSGSLVYVTGGDERLELLLFDSLGSAMRIGAPRRFLREARFAPDGDRAAVTVVSDTALSADVWIYDLRSRTTIRLTADDASNDQYPEWTADGKYVLFCRVSGGRPTAFWRIADASLPEARVRTGVCFAEVARDGRSLLALRAGKLWSGRLGPDTILAEIPRIDGVVTAAKLSPDARWIAYAARPTTALGTPEQSEIFIARFPEGGPPLRVSESGGTEPRWSADGRRVFYVAGRRNVGEVIAATVVTTPTLRIDDRASLFTFDARTTLFGDVAPDGRRMLAFRWLADTPTVVVRHGWLRPD